MPGPAQERRLPRPHGRRIWLIYGPLTDGGEFGRADLLRRQRGDASGRGAVADRRRGALAGMERRPGSGRGRGERSEPGSQPGKRRDRIPPSPAPPDKLFRVGTPTRRAAQARQPLAAARTPRENTRVARKIKPRKGGDGALPPSSSTGLLELSAPRLSPAADSSLPWKRRSKSFPVSIKHGQPAKALTWLLPPWQGVPVLGTCHVPARVPAMGGGAGDCPTPCVRGPACPCGLTVDPRAMGREGFAEPRSSPEPALGTARQDDPSHAQSDQTAAFWPRTPCGAGGTAARCPLPSPAPPTPYSI